MAKESDHRGFKLHKIADYDSPPVGAADGKPQWALKGIEHVDDPPQHVIVPVSTIDMGISEGWISREGEKVVHKPGGPKNNPWAVTHTFTHCDTFTVHTVDGDLVYKVTHQPDKYGADGKPTDAAGDPDATVDWFYRASLEG